MRESIEKFNEQFDYEPTIENLDNFKPSKSFVVIGMGGSNLAAALIKTWRPEIDVIIHKDYGLPNIARESLSSRLIIASSYSGNTEETIDGLNKAIDAGIPIVVISTGGKMLQIARNKSLPCIQLPSTGIQPRMALGFSLKAILKAMGDEDSLEKTGKLSKNLTPKKIENQGKDLAAKLAGFVPIIYTSTKNKGLAYNWKIKFNETGKIPAFYNVLPELNHNEMTGFDVRPESSSLSKNFRFIFLEDNTDHPQIKKRMSVLKDLYKKRGLESITISLEGDALMKIFSSSVLADWAAYHTALNYKLEPEEVPLVEEFKKLIAD